MNATLSFFIFIFLAGLSMLLFQRIAMILSINPKQQRHNNLFSLIIKTKPKSLIAELLIFLAGVCFFSLFFLLLQRPITSLILTLVVGSLLVILNYTKESILHEPVVLADAWLLKQAVQFPDLYLPFLPLKKIFILISISILSLACAIFFEQPLSELNTFFSRILPLIIVISLPSLLILMAYSKLSPLASFLLYHCPVSSNAVNDAKINGVFSAALIHPLACGILKKQAPDFLNYKQNKIKPIQTSYLKELDIFINTQNIDQPEHLILIQAESFWDIRPYFSQLKDVDLLPNWDKLKSNNGVLSLETSPFGAYTMRTEFSVLTGLKEEMLGPLFFNPYLLAQHQPLWSITRELKELGYNSLCLHPYAKKFFNRSAVMPNLGFDRFLGLEDLNQLSHFGPYISDSALADLIISEIQISKQPLFCFVITMEAHGPWLNARLSNENVTKYFIDNFHSLGLNKNDFSLAEQYYLIHLKNMDKMFGKIQNYFDKLEEQNKKGKLIVYGDHPPSLPALRKNHS